MELLRQQAAAAALEVHFLKPSLLFFYFSATNIFIKIVYLSRDDFDIFIQNGKFCREHFMFGFITTFFNCPMFKVTESLP